MDSDWLKHSFPASTSTERSPYGLSEIIDALLFFFSFGITTLLANKKKRGKREEAGTVAQRNAFEADKNMAVPDSVPTPSHLVWGQAVLGVVTWDSKEFLTSETANGFAEDEALALRGLLLQSPHFVSSSTPKSKTCRTLFWDFWLSKKYRNLSLWCVFMYIYINNNCISSLSFAVHSSFVPFL